MTGFPRELLSLLRCARDAGTLCVAAEVRGDATTLTEALLRCDQCGTAYPIKDGIARFMPGLLSAEDEREIGVRDAEFAAARQEQRAGEPASLSDLMEVPALASAVRPEGCRVLEIGSGSGRFTLIMAKAGARVLAVDFSLNALHALASRLGPTALHERVGLVHASACELEVAPRSFERAFSTTSLDTREQRMAMYRMIAGALTDDGRFVGSVEHDDLARRLLGLPSARRYPNGIFLEHFSAAQLRREAAPYFARLRISRIRPRVPFIHRMPRAVALPVSRAVLALPVMRDLAELLVVRAERPIRPAVEGARRPGSSAAKAIFRWYSRRLGRAARWEENEPV